LRRLETIILRLRKWPNVSGATPLRGGLAGHWRLRTGDWRVQFRVVGDEVIIERVGHRDGFYE
jgi:mRNA-degrading endonuclease RelE of RelBE toxin-antitoxin system